MTRASLVILSILVVSALSGPLSGTSAQDPPTYTREQVVQMMQEISNWGRWGPDDQLGTFNLITPQKRLEAVGLVTEGLSVSLAHRLDKEVMADNPTPFKQEFLMQDGRTLGAAMEVITSMYHRTTTTHMDALCHYQFDGLMYNGYAYEDFYQATQTREGFGEGPGCMRNDVLNFKAGFMTRGVLVDMPLLNGVEWLEPGTPVTVADLEAWEEFAGVEIGPGDALFLRTGRFARRAALGPWPAANETAGFHVSVMPWIKARDVALLSSDAVQDVQPSGVENFGRPIHTVSIVTLGMPMIDVADLEEVAELAARLERWEFMLTVTALPAPGGSGSPVNPTATF